MPRDGTGTYNAPESPAVTATPITASGFNATISDLGSALTQSLSRDGQTVPSAPLPMGTFRHTNVGNATARNEYAALGQVQDGGATWGGTAGGTANALTLALSPAITTYTAGMTIRFAPSNSNSGATTLNVNGVGAVAVLTPASAACTGGEIKNGHLCTVTYNGAAWILQTVPPMPTANLPMNTFRHTNVGNATARNEYAALGQVQDGGATWGGTAGGTANALTLALSPAITTYTAGMTIRFAPSNSNSGATTLNVNGVGAVAVLTPASAACTGGEIKNNQPCTVTYNGAAWILQTVLPMPTATTSGGIVGSIQALNSGTGSSLTLPAGGTWVAWWIGVTISSGAVTGVPEMFEGAGGTTVKAGSAGVAFYGWAWRKA